MSTADLRGKVALVTGGSSGIGRGVCTRFAQEGARVIVASRRRAACELVVGEIRNLGGTAEAVEVDVANESSVDEMYRWIDSSQPALDVVVASAGISGGNDRVADYDLEKWNRVITTNLTGMFLTMRGAFNLMKSSGGNLVAISSQAGVEGYAGKGVYSASKFGVRGLCRVLAEEGREFGISVSSLCPGTVDTPILRATNTNVTNPLEMSAVTDAAVYLATLNGNGLVHDIVLERQALR